MLVDEGVGGYKQSIAGEPSRVPSLLGCPFQNGTRRFFCGSLRPNPALYRVLKYTAHAQSTFSMLAPSTSMLAKSAVTSKLGAISPQASLTISRPTLKLGDQRVAASTMCVWEDGCVFFSQNRTGLGKLPTQERTCIDR